MNSNMLPRDAAPLPADRSSAAVNRDPRVVVPGLDAPPAAAPPASENALALGLLVTILFFGIPLLLYCVLTSP
ncbi:hypothetical protein [Sphingomonas sp. NPDC079357]|uniref:hypothetical protein n=1 Tax=Sphingomonas sp. NPDC079357 TaxID=3364518 RepID=UPI003850935A